MSLNHQHIRQNNTVFTVTKYREEIHLSGYTVEGSLSISIQPKTEALSVVGRVSTAECEACSFSVKCGI